MAEILFKKELAVHIYSRITSRSVSFCSGHKIG